MNRETLEIVEATLPALGVAAVVVALVFGARWCCRKFFKRFFTSDDD